MLIDYNILITYGGVARKYNKGEIIFLEESIPNFFFQIIDGRVRLFSTNSDGKELTQGYFSTGQSFGEPPLFVGKPYPATAIACENSVVVKIGKDKVMNILQDYPEILNKLFFNFAERIYNKASSAQVLISHTPEERLMQFFHQNINRECETDRELVPYTRQEIADFTGLRVETVIRTLLRMNKQGKIKILQHKIYY